MPEAREDDEFEQVPGSTGRNPEATGIRKHFRSEEDSCFGEDPLYSCSHEEHGDPGMANLRFQSSQTSDRSRTPEKAKTPKRARTPNRTKTPDRGKAPMAQASHAPAPDCLIVERWAPSPSQVMSVWECQATSVSCGRNRERMVENDHSPQQSARKLKKMLAAARSGSEAEHGSREQSGPSASRAFSNQGDFWPPEEVLPPSIDQQVNPKMERRQKNTAPLELDLGMQLYVDQN